MAPGKFVKSLKRQSRRQPKWWSVHPLRAIHLTVILATIQALHNHQTIAQVQAQSINGNQQHQLVSMSHNHHQLHDQQAQLMSRNQNVMPSGAGSSVSQQQQGGAMLASASSQSSSAMAPLFKDLSGPTSGKIQTLDVICGKNFMTVRAEFSGPFYGIVFSKGTYGQENCIYVKPNSGLTHAAFNVYYDQCGTKPDLQGKFYENTIVIQYGSDIIEAYDEAKRLRCEWFEAYEKPATFKPAIPVADLEVVEMNFQGDDIDCWMEIQEGTGPSSREVSKIVPVGQPMTIVVAINDYNGQFDMRVKSCVAHDGVQQPIALTDEFGCVLRPKMLTAFQKVRNPGGIHKKATILSYSRFLAFKFPDSMTVQIQCTVEVCRHGCADACQRIPSTAATTMQPELSLSAKWPAASNQPAIEMSASNRPTRVQFGADQAAASRPPASLDSPAVSSDEMSGSESNQQPAMLPNSPQQQPAQQVPTVQQQQQYRRSQDRPLPLGAQLDGRIPQYLTPIGGHRRQPQLPLHGARLAPTSTSTTSAPQTAPTIPQAVAESNQPAGEDNRAQQSPPSESEGPTDNSSSSEAGTGEPQLIAESKSEPEQGQGGLPAEASSQSASVGASSNDSSEPERNKADASPDKPSGVEASSSSAPASAAADQQLHAIGQEAASQSAPQSSADKQQASPSGDQMVAESSEVKPSVQGSDDEQQQQQLAKKSEFASQQQQQSGSLDTSLKTVEVEIPANEDPVRAQFLSAGGVGGNGNTNNEPGQTGFSSVRINDAQQANAPSASYDSVMFENSRYQDQAPASANREQAQIIQPRESQPNSKRDKADQEDSLNFEATAAIGGSGKMRFGARAQPQQHSQAAASLDEQSQAANHKQLSSVDSQQGQPQPAIESRSDISGASAGSSASEQSRVDAGSNGKEGSSAGVVNPDRILIDRSDDSSMIELVNSPTSEGSKSAIDVSSQDAEQSSLSSPSNKVMPVVGTDELATGPVQLEDRIGAPAPPSQPQHSESLEEALTRLQQQIPQTAALVSSANHQPESKMQGASDGDQLRSEAIAAQQQSQSTVERVDQQAATRKDQRPQGSSPHKSDNQPHPNVAGQAKVLPDPSSSVSASQRGAIQTQASNAEGVAVVMSPPAQPNGYAQQPHGHVQMQQQQQQQQQQGFGKPQMQQQHQMPHQMIDTQQSKPVAQITNVPIGIGFPPSQIPAIQQLQQQLAQQYQQQQQHLYQQQQQQQQQKQQTPQQPLPQQSSPKPTRGRFNLLSPQAAIQAVASRLLPKSQQPQPNRLPLVNQQLLTNLQQQQQQQLTPEQQKLIAQQQQATNFMAQQQQPFAVNQATAPANQPQTKPPGLFSRLTSSLHSQHQQQPQQPLVRTRRSALKPNGDNRGEVGITKGFLVVSGMDLAFSPSLTDSDMPQILKGHKALAIKASDPSDGEIVYGICMPIVSLTFVLTCAFWLIVFLLAFCIYLFINSRKQRQSSSSELKKGAGDLSDDYHFSSNLN